jgi:ATP-dependent Clp protease ATP-binding subunit ClpX
VLLDVMFEIPSRGDVKKVVIDADAINRRHPAQIVVRGESRAVELEDESA